MKMHTTSCMATVLFVIAHIVISDAAPARAKVDDSHSAEAQQAQDALSLPCKQTTGMWGDVNPNIYYVCDAQTQRAKQLRCPEGRGFFNGFGYYGCIPYEQWPACTSADSHHQVVCDAEHQMQTWAAYDPNKFYMCQGERREPLLTNCTPDRGFVNAWIHEQDGRSGKIMGCASWDKWRAYMRCEAFY